MPYVRLTVIRPLPGQHENARALLEKIEHLFADDPGMLMGFEFGDAREVDAPIGRVAVWESNTAANKRATSTAAIGLRAELQRLCREDIVDSLSEITHSHWTEAGKRMLTEGEN